MPVMIDHVNNGEIMSVIMTVIISVMVAVICRIIITR